MNQSFYEDNLDDMDALADCKESSTCPMCDASCECRVMRLPNIEYHGRLVCEACANDIEERHREE